RVGSLVGTSGIKWTTEEPTMPCHRVLPDNLLTRRTDGQAPVYKVSEGNGLHESSPALNNSIMVVEKIKNECNRRRIATSVERSILSKEPDLTYYMEGIKEFGFNHIIIVGERDDGMLFLDCY